MAIAEVELSDALLATVPGDKSLISPTIY